MFSACENSRPRTELPARCEDSSMWNNCFARSTPSAEPSSLIQPSRDVAFTPNWLSIAFRFCGSLLKSWCATRAFSKCKVSLAMVLSLSQRGAQPGGNVLECIRHHRRICNHRHKVRVTIPPRHDMDVQVFDDAGARHFAKVDADVETMRIHDFRQRVLAALRQLQQVQHLAVRQL